jgi:hypothetical protein
MRFVYVLGSGHRYQNKIARMRYRDMQRQRRARRHAAAVARWNALSQAQKTVVLLAAAVFVIACMITGCGGSPAPSAAACKTALSQQVASAEAHPCTGASMTEPASCKGLPAATYRRIAVQVTDESLRKVLG